MKRAFNFAEMTSFNMMTIALIQGQKNVLEGQKKNLENTIQKLENEIKTLTAENESAASEIASLQAQIQSMQGMKHGMGSIAAMVAVIGGLKAKIQANKQKIQSAKGMIASSKSQVAQITRTITKLNDKMKEMSGWMGKIVAEIRDIDTNASNKLKPKVQQSNSLLNKIKEIENYFKNNYLKKYGISGVGGYSTGKVTKLPNTNGSNVSKLPHTGDTPEIKKTELVLTGTTVLGLLFLLVIGVITKDELADALGMAYDGISGIFSDLRNGFITADEAAARIISRAEAEEKAAEAGTASGSTESGEAAEGEGEIDQTPSEEHSTQVGGSSLPKTGVPNSSKDLVDENGNVKQRRWYGPDGNAERDVDYSHGGAKHNFPHEHTWEWNGEEGTRF